MAGWGGEGEGGGGGGGGTHRWIDVVDAPPPQKKTIWQMLMMTVVSVDVVIAPADGLGEILSVSPFYFILFYLILFFILGKSFL